MTYFDEQVTSICEGIDANIATILENGVSRDLASKNVLADLRHLAEHIFKQVYCRNNNDDFAGPEGEYDLLQQKAKPYIEANGKYRFLKEFHTLVSKTNSHYSTQVDEGSRLLMHYLEFLFQIRDFEKDKFGLTVLKKLKEYPLRLDSNDKVFYKKVTDKYLEIKGCVFAIDDEAYYVVSKKSIRGFGPSIYEMVLAPANNHIDKFNRFTVFTDEDVMTCYSIKAKFHESTINLLDTDVRILFMKDATISIRPIEIENYFKIVGEKLDVRRSQKSYQQLMSYIQSTGNTIADIMQMDAHTFNLEFPRFADEKSRLGLAIKEMHKSAADKCIGWKTVVYLAAEMNNNIIKNQLALQPEWSLNSPFNLHKGVYAFERTPFFASLRHHNPSLLLLTRYFNQNDAEDELLARAIRNNSLENNNLYLSEKELSKFKDKERLIQLFNSKTLPQMHISSFAGNYYIQGAFDTTRAITKILESKNSSGLLGYQNNAVAFIQNLPDDKKDDIQKVEILTKLFSNQKIGLIYGPAGTGKSTLVSMVCQMFPNVEKVIASTTKTAVDHLKRICEEKTQHHFYTIAQLKESRNLAPCKILIVDECSMVENRAMQRVLENVDCESMLLAGDTDQLESISFGNWFLISKYLLPSNTIHELNNKFRTKEPGLTALWDSVRSCSKDIGPIIQRHHYAKNISNEIFKRTSGDEIILCPNYDGIYGINNLNAYLQAANKATAFEWQHRIYKKGDPILFVENKRFGNILYNNLKGLILDIYKDSSKITFEIQIPRTLTEWDIDSQSGLRLKGSENGKSIIEFSVEAWDEGSDDESKDEFRIVPFQIAYAASINKAQGLEFDSVKIVISNDVTSRIDYNSFYTAITRSKKKLTIFWSAETEKAIIDGLKNDLHKKDVCIYKSHIKSLESA